MDRIYRLFVEESVPEGEIARRLNIEGLRTDLGREWTRSTICQILVNPKYIGNNVYNRASFKLKKKRVRNPREMWIQREGAFDGIVPPGLYFMAQGIVRERNRRFSDEEMLAGLKALLERNGQLSASLIDETAGLPASAIYRLRFGSLIRAYKLVGFSPGRDFEFIESNRQIRGMYPQILSTVTERIRAMGGTISRDLKTDLLTVNGEFTASLLISKCRETTAGGSRWLIRLDAGLEPDLTVAIRLNPSNSAPQDYYLLPACELHTRRLVVGDENCLALDAFCFPSLDHFFGMAERIRIREVL